jgi:1,4-dihydroxy-2-naphthoate octaprenyltransferase
MGFKDYLVDIFEPTLLFGFLTGLLGIAAAVPFSRIALVPAILAVLGVVLAQIGVNHIDDYVDFSSGIDKETSKTKFSGGNRLMTSGRIKPAPVLGIGLVSTAIAIVIGIYLILAHTILIPIVIVGAISVLFYAKYVTKVPFAAEPLSALAFALVPIGTFIVAGGPLGLLGHQLFAFVPAGIMVASAILVNGMPDRAADKKHGRRNAAALLWHSKRVALYYIAIQMLAFILILYGVLTHALASQFALAIVMAVPSAYVAAGMYFYKRPKTHEQYMAVHAALSFLLYVLLIVAYLI